MSSKQSLQTKRLLSEAYRYVYTYYTHFDLKLPIIVSISKCKRFNDDCFALLTIDNQSTKIENHHITLSFDRHYKDYEELRNTIFHELVHCWQYENDFDVEHDEKFWDWESIANDYGVTIRYEDDEFKQLNGSV